MFPMLEKGILSTLKPKLQKSKTPFLLSEPTQTFVKNAERSKLNGFPDRFSEHKYISIFPKHFKTRSHLLLTDRSHWNPVG